MDEYKFDFSKATVKDFMSLLDASGGLAAIIDFADKVTVGGIDTVPMSDMTRLIAQLYAAIREYFEEAGDSLASLRNYYSGD